jgi:hypothetical protein
LLLHEKNQLETVLGHKIDGVRQHYLNLDKNTWKLQKDLGFKYDSSLGFKSNIGFINHHYLPFRPYPKFIVVPLVIMDSCIFSKKNPWSEYVKIMNIAITHRALVTINWHQRVFNENEFKNYSKLYEKIIKCSLENGAWVGPISDAISEMKIN